MNINLSYNSLYDTVSRSLSVIGKRLTDDNGKPLFADITLGSLEKPLITDYFRQAVIDLTAELAAFITAASSENVTFAITLPDNHNPHTEEFIIQSCEAYCVSYALYSWFTITAPRLAEKYLNDCRRQVAAVIRLTHLKEAPSQSDNILSTSTTVQTDIDTVTESGQS